VANYRVLILILSILIMTQAKEIPDGFLSVKDKIPNIVLDLRYYSDNNFMGKAVKGYTTNRAILTQEAIEALANAQEELNRFNLGLKIFDAYRPQKSVDNFVEWGKDLDDTLKKYEYYPTVDKKNLFRDGYIAKKSGHSRGSTIDLTIVDLKSREELDMGSSFDFFGKKSWVKYPNITAQQRANRLLLNTIMRKFGFRAYSKEWWHFTLKREPYPDRYFNFDI
jgi:D-alanyl-D-alanine dipeptidase